MKTTIKRLLIMILAAAVTAGACTAAAATPARIQESKVISVKLDGENKYSAAYEVLDLNLLKDAYLLQLVARVLEENGYTEGYLTAESGLCVTLSGYDKAQYCVYELTDSGVALKKTLPAKPGSAASVFRAFPLREKEAYFCRIEKDGKVYYRNPYVTLGAEGFHNLIQNACVISETDPVDAVYTNIRLHACENTEQVEQIMLENAQYTYDISFFP